VTSIAQRETVVPAKRVKGHPNGERFRTAESFFNFLKICRLIGRNADGQPDRELRGLTFAGGLVLPLCIFWH
jgi:hypothetical protein